MKGLLARLFGTSPRDERFVAIAVPESAAGSSELRAQLAHEIRLVRILTGDATPEWFLGGSPEWRGWSLERRALGPVVLFGLSAPAAADAHYAAIDVLPRVAEIVASVERVKVWLLDASEGTGKSAHDHERVRVLAPVSGDLVETDEMEWLAVEGGARLAPDAAERPWNRLARELGVGDGARLRARLRERPDMREDLELERQTIPG